MLACTSLFYPTCHLFFFFFNSQNLVSLRFWAWKIVNRSTDRIYYRFKKYIFFITNFYLYFSKNKPKMIFIINLICIYFPKIWTLKTKRVKTNLIPAQLSSLSALLCLSTTPPLFIFFLTTHLRRCPNLIAAPYFRAIFFFFDE